MTIWDWLIIGGIVAIILIPPKYDPAIRLREWLDGWQPDSGKDFPTKPPRGGTTGSKR